MSAVGVMLIGFGLLTAWSGWELVNVFDILRSFIGAPSSPINPNPGQSGPPTAPPAGGGAPAPRAVRA